MITRSWKLLWVIFTDQCPGYPHSYAHSICVGVTTGAISCSKSHTLLKHFSTNLIHIDNSVCVSVCCDLNLWSAFVYFFAKDLFELREAFLTVYYQALFLNTYDSFDVVCSNY